jgi:hypothetical protein
MSESFKKNVKRRSYNLTKIRKVRNNKKKIYKSPVLSYGRKEDIND